MFVCYLGKKKAPRYSKRDKQGPTANNRHGWYMDGVHISKPTAILFVAHCGVCDIGH